MELMKRCLDCDILKSVNDFYKSKTSYQSYCKQCYYIRTKLWRINNRIKYNLNARKWIKDNPDKINNHRLKCLYGITYQEFKQMVIDQDYKCLICGIKFNNAFEKNRDTQIDHNHKTSKVRGILCKKCNRSLGWYEKYDNQVNNYIRCI